MTRVFVAHASSAIVRAGLESLVATSPALTIVGSSSGTASGVKGFAGTINERIDELQPDVILVELEAQDQETISELLTLNSERTESHLVAIVILADEYQVSWTSEAVRSGIRAVLPRTTTGEEIVAAIEAAAAGLAVLHPEVIDSLLAGTQSIESTARTSSTSEIDALTEREREVLGMLAEGLGNKTIAYRLGISEHTIKFHVASIFGKLNVSSRTEAVTQGLRRGLILL